MKAATPSNSPGDFYVAAGECITCGAPEAEAPALMSFDEEAHSCFFERQPSTLAELNQAIGAVSVSCCRAVRYRGSDFYVQRELKKRDSLDSVDVPLDRLVRG
jgi:hypothetical protein